MKVFKYPLELADKIVLKMPENAQMLCVQVQYGSVCLWAAVDPEAPDEKRTIYVRGTGHELGMAAVSKYIGTFQLTGGALVFHVFDGGSSPFE